MQSTLKRAIHMHLDHNKEKKNEKIQILQEKVPSKVKK